MPARFASAPRSGKLTATTCKQVLHKMTATHLRLKFITQAIDNRLFPVRTAIVRRPNLRPD